MIKYKDTTNIITTDDITVSGGTNLGKTITELIEDQSLKINALSSNVKWLAKYGGVGGSGGGGSTANTKLKFNGTIFYTDLNGNAATKAFTHLDTSGFFIQVKANSIVTVTITILSALSLPLYSATVSCGSKLEVSGLFNMLSSRVSLNICPENAVEVCSLLVKGEQTITIPFNCYTKITEDDIKVCSGEYLTLKDTDVAYTSYKENGLVLNVDVTNNITEIFSIEYDSLTINDTAIDTSEIDDLFKIRLNINDYFDEYGLYNIKYVYKIIEIATQEVTERELTMLLLYKDSNSIFVLCYAGANNLIVDSKNTYTPSKVCSDRNVPIKYKIYGRSTDAANARYRVDVNGTTASLSALSNKEYEYYISNDSIKTTGEWKNIEFIIDNSSTNKQTYYYFVKLPPAITYILLYEQADKLYPCYLAVGQNTEDTVTTIFPSKTAGAKYWEFSEETVIKIGETPKGAITALSTLKSFVTNNLRIEGSTYYDAVFSIGIKYNDVSYKNPILSVNSGITGAIKSIVLYRNKIYYGKSSDQFAMPNDGKFHLITIYIKNTYHDTTEITDTTYRTTPYFAIYIDGILEFSPTEINDFIFSTDTNITLYKGKTQYNHFGLYYVNARPATYDLYNTRNYLEIIKKYLTDFDPIIPSNYYMVYNNEYIEDTGKEAFPESAMLSADIYSTLIVTTSGNSSNWINYYNPDLQNKIFKFLRMDVNTLYKLLGNADLPIYKIKPDVSKGDNTFGLNDFVYNTFKSIQEAEEKHPTTCSLYKAYINELGKCAWTPLFNASYLYIGLSGQTITVPIKFQVRYQGSSTLLYSVKNFEIEVLEATVGDDKMEISFNPNPSLWNYPEKAFNLKADLVDSSSSTNNVVANFVNKYMTSPFGTDYAACLSGCPILLFIENNVEGGAENLDLFLGIYNLNLGRSSINNLGYLKLPTGWKDSNNVHPCNINGDNSYLYIRHKTLEPTSHGEFYVAEIAGNNEIYDFTLYNSKLLENMFGDYFYADSASGAIKEDYFTKLENLGRDFSNLCYDKITSQVFNLWEYHYDTATDLRSTLVNSQSDKKIYYWDNNTHGPKEVSLNTKVVAGSTLGGNEAAYKTFNSDTKVSYVGNPIYLFRPVTDISGNIISTQEESIFYSILKRAGIVYNEEDNVNIFDLELSLRYYMVCMAFAMVDSVQKNLTVKSVGDNNIWYPAFYDMDTGLGLNNAGGNSNYLAFTDFVDSDGTIIQDYVKPGTTGWFDTPSSYLFMYAKYYELLNPPDEGAVNTPYKYWSSLRGISTEYASRADYKLLENAQSFCENFLYKHIPDNLPPIIWNLNYAYKYFSKSLNDKKDTEKGRFNGTMKHRRLDWLNNRLHYLDVLFGVANSRNIGTSNEFKISSNSSDTANSDVLICDTMFPFFKKGAIPGQINAKVTDLPKVPFVIKIKQAFKVLVTDDDGEATVNFTLSTDDDYGFLGSTNLQTVSEVGQFLQSSSSESSMKGSQILNIIITDDRVKSIVLDKTDIPSVNNISIGTDSKITTDYDIIIKDNKGVSLNINSIIIKNFDILESKLTISNLYITSLSISNFTAEEIEFVDCQFKSAVDLTSTINVKTIKISGCTFASSFKLTSSVVEIVKLDNNKFGDTSTFIIDCIAIKQLYVDKLEGGIFKNTYANNLTSSEDAYPKVLSLKNVTIKEIHLHEKGEADPGWTSAYSNSIITTINISSSYAGNLKLAVPRFCSMTSLTVERPEDTILYLMNGGIACSKITQIDDTTKITASAREIFTSCSELNISDWLDTKLNYIFSEVTTAEAMFALIYKKIDFNTLKRIIIALKKRAISAKISLNCSNLFHGTTFTTSLTLLECDKLGKELESLRPYMSSYNGIFYGTNVTYYTKAFKNFTNFSSFLGACYVESGALNNATTINNYEDGASRMMTFINVYRNTSGDILDADQNDSTKLTGSLLLHIKYNELFSKCTSLMVNIYTQLNTNTEGDSNEVYFDYSGILSVSTLNYYSLFGTSSTVTFPNIRNFDTWISNNYNKINFKSLEFKCTLTYSIEDLKSSTALVGATLLDKIEKYYTNYYNLLVDSDGNLRTKLINIQKRNGAMWYIYKYLTIALFKELLIKLAEKKITNLSSLFSNCIILVDSNPEDSLFTTSKTVTLDTSTLNTGESITTDTYYTNSTGTNIFNWTTFYSDELTTAGFTLGNNSRTYTYGLLNSFTTLWGTFQNMHVITLQNAGTDFEEYPINLNNSFLAEGLLSSTSKTKYLYKKTTYIDEEGATQTVYEKVNVGYKFPIYAAPSKSSNIQSMESSFPITYLVPFKNINLQIKDNTVTDMDYAFLNCRFAYGTYTTLNLWAKSGAFSNVQQPSNADTWAILPEGFFNCVKTGTTLTGTFSTWRSTKECILGYLPLSSTYLKNNGSIILDYTFKGALIYWNLFESKTPLTDSWYGIFPEWYTKGGNGLYDVKIPLPVSSNLGKSCLFYITGGSMISVKTYETLPAVPASVYDESLPSHFYYNTLEFGNADLTLWCPPIYPTNIGNQLPKADDNLYNLIIPYRLAYLLKATGNIIDEFKTSWMTSGQYLNTHYSRQNTNSREEYFYKGFNSLYTDITYYIQA